MGDAPCDIAAQARPVRSTFESENPDSSAFLSEQHLLDGEAAKDLSVIAAKARRMRIHLPQYPVPVDRQGLRVATQVQSPRQRRLC